MLAISALSGKLAEPITIGPDADSDPEAPDEAAAEAVEELEEASGSDDPQADSANAAASPAAISTLARVRVERTDTGYSLAGGGLAGSGRTWSRQVGDCCRFQRRVRAVRGAWGVAGQPGSARTEVHAAGRRRIGTEKVASQQHRWWN